MEKDLGAKLSLYEGGDPLSSGDLRSSSSDNDLLGQHSFQDDGQSGTGCLHCFIQALESSVNLEVFEPHLSTTSHLASS